MLKKFIYLAFLFSCITIKSQELNCLVNINYNQVQGSNVQVFKTLETALTEFVNQTKWTNRIVKPEERIDCVMNIIVTSRTDNTFTATLQVQSQRPVFGTSYSSPVLNIKDNDFNFKYNEILNSDYLYSTILALGFLLWQNPTVLLRFEPTSHRFQNRLRNLSDVGSNLRCPVLVTF